MGGLRRWVLWLGLLASLGARADGRGAAPPPRKSSGPGFTGGLHVALGAHGPKWGALTRLEVRAGVRFNRSFALVGSVSGSATPFAFVEQNPYSYDLSPHAQAGVLVEWRPREVLTLSLGPLLSVGSMVGFRIDGQQYLGYTDAGIRPRFGFDVQARLAVPTREPDDARRWRFTVGVQLVTLFLTETTLYWPSGVTVDTLVSLSPLLSLGVEWR